MLDTLINAIYNRDTTLKIQNKTVVGKTVLCPCFQVTAKRLTCHNIRLGPVS